MDYYYDNRSATTPNEPVSVLLFGVIPTVLKQESQMIHSDHSLWSNSASINAVTPSGYLASRPFTLRVTELVNNPN